MKTKLFLTGIALIALTFIASGQKADTDSKQVNTGNWGPAFVDKNNDGVCDNIDSRPNQQGQGRAYNRGGRGYGRANCYRGGNGPAPGQGKGYGRGQGRGPGKGQGRLYVDKNNDGVCDNFENATKKD